MRKSIAESITSTITDLNKSGLVDDITMKNIENLCLPEVKKYTPTKIASLRKSLHLSQANTRSGQAELLCRAMPEMPGADLDAKIAFINQWFATGVPHNR